MEDLSRSHKDMSSSALVTMRRCSLNGGIGTGMERNLVKEIPPIIPVISC
jgi:hypothetical protein